MESFPTPLDQPFAQATLPAQTTLDPGHPAVIPLVIIAKKMQQAVQSQHPKLSLDWVAGASGLAARNSACDRDFAEKSRLLAGERQHVGRRILPPVPGVELPHPRVRDERHHHGAACRSRSRGLQPPGQTGCATANGRHDFHSKLRRPPGRHPFGEAIGGNRQVGRAAATSAHPRARWRPSRRP
jgi:hypothetical protein